MQNYKCYTKVWNSVQLRGGAGEELTLIINLAAGIQVPQGAGADSMRSYSTRLVWPK